MGLDVTVYRILKEPKDKNRYFRLIDDEGNYKNNFPEWTKPLEHTVTEDWYDWDKFKEQTGIDLEQCDWHGESYGEDGAFMKVSPKGVELPQWNGGEGWKDWDEFEEAENKIMIKIDLNKVPLYKKEIKVVYIDEIGYQRKGLNGKFYEDYQDGKIGYFVWSLDELKRYKDEYCDEPYEYQYPNGKMSGEMVYPKDDFQKNIIDTFVEGECCVTFDW
jgi:hypothetical protein